MLRLTTLALAAAVAFSAPAFAQTEPEGAHRDLWCGIAFGTAAADMPADATEEQKAMAQQFIDGGTMLIDRASAAYIAATFTEEQVATMKTDLTPKVSEQIMGSGDTAEFTFEECSSLLPAPITP